MQVSGEPWHAAVSMASSMSDGNNKVCCSLSLQPSLDVSCVGAQLRLTVETTLSLKQRLVMHRHIEHNADRRVPVPAFTLKLSVLLAGHSMDDFM